MLDLLGLIADRFVYFPDRHLIATPADVGLDYEDVYFRTGDGLRLHGWFVPGGPASPLLWLHGNGGNISYAMEALRMLHQALNRALFLADYRGYGLSDGSPSEKGLYRDAEAALAELTRRSGVDTTDVVVFGQSLGSAVAVDLAVRQRVRALVLESPFTSLHDMARHVYPALPLGPLLRGRYDSIGKIRQVEEPLLILHGAGDDVVPAWMGKRLFEVANEPKRFRMFDGCSHNDICTVAGADYVATLRTFVEEVGSTRIA